MEFLNPAALYALFLLPLLLVPYLIKGRARRLFFSSLLLLKELPSRPTARPWGRLYLPPLFFLQLLLLLLLLLALGEPVSSVRPMNVALVLDNSASMQALEGKKSRFQMAQDKAASILRGLPSRARIDLYLIVPGIERITDEPLTPGEATTRTSSLRTLDLGEPIIDYGAELSRLVKERGYERLYFLTDHPAQGQSESVRLISLGRPKGNLAISSLQVTRSSFASLQLKARVEVANFSAGEEKFKLILKGGGKELFSRSTAAAPGKSIESSFENLPFHPSYEAVIEVSDGLALDNRRFAVPPPSTGLKILAISPRPEALLSLRSIPGLEITLVSPQTYGKGNTGPHDLEIFHYSAPAALPESDALMVLPPSQNPVVALGAASSRPPVSGWREPHPLTRYVNFSLFRPILARALKPLLFGETIIQGPDGPLSIALEHKGFRTLVLGFDPFPFLGRENLPMSIFTLNLLEWFHQAKTATGSATGEPLDLRPLRGEVLLTPAGEKIALQETSARFYRTYLQGLYQVTRGTERTLLAVNFQDGRESDLSNPAAIQLREEPAAVASRPFYAALWPYLLFVSLLLLLLEWFINPAPARRETNRAWGET